MSDIDGSVGMACYAAFALQQALSLDVLESAAAQAELPIAAGVGGDPGLRLPPTVSPADAAAPSADHVAAMLAAAPELDGTVIRRRITD